MNVMLHVHGSCLDRDAVPPLVVEMSVAFPQFFHAFLCLEDREDRGAVQMLNDSGIRVFHGKLSKDIRWVTDPVIIVLHDVGGDSVEGKPWKWLKEWKTISFHYNAVRPTIPTDFHVFTSDKVQRWYGNLIKSGFITRWGTIPIEFSTSTAPWFHKKLSEKNITGIRADLSPIIFGLLLNTPFQPTPKPSSIWGLPKTMLLARGVIVGCGSEQEWMLPWWWENYSKYNNLPVLFIDMGMGEKAMTQKAKQWCGERGFVGDLHLPLAGWFQKPFALAMTVFEESVWLDVDVEIRGSLVPAFDYCKHGIAAAPDPYYRSKVPVSLNSGVIAFEFGNKMISDWCSMISREGKDYRDDQIILNVLAHKNPGSVGNLPREFNWLRLDGDSNPGAVCIHWTGSEGKEIIRAKMTGKYLREHFIADLVNTKGWIRGLEIGTKRGRTFLHLLGACPKLEMTTIDLWEPQPENKGPERYTKEEGWNHDENEIYVRKGAEKFGSRAIILKGDSKELVPKLSGEFDFVFVDGDHSSEAVKTDILNCLWKLKPSGVLMGHDIDWPSVHEVVVSLFSKYLVGPDNVWGVWARDVLGPRGCPRGDEGVGGPTGIEEDLCSTDS